MSATQTPTGFSLEAILTRLIPGLVLISPFLLTLWLFGPDILNDLSISLLIISLVALIAGELLDQMRSGLFRTPISFRYYMYAATGDASHLPKWYRCLIRLDEKLPNWFNLVEEISEEAHLEERLQFDLHKNMEDALDLDSNSAWARDFYDALILYIGEDISPRTRQYRSAYIFNQNLKVATGVSFCLYVYYIFARYPDPIIWIYVLAALTLVILVFMITRFLMASPHVYFEMLVKDFYMKKTTD